MIFLRKYMPEEKHSRRDLNYLSCKLPRIFFSDIFFELNLNIYFEIGMLGSRRYGTHCIMNRLMTSLFFL